MRFFLLFCLAVLLSWLYAPTYIFAQIAAVVTTVPAPPTEKSLTGRTVYYFVDSECIDCTPGADLPAGKYWVLSRGVQVGEYQAHTDLLENFRQALHARFGQRSGLMDAQAFRFYDTRAEAEAVRLAELEARQRAGYQVLEVDLEQ